MNAVVTPVLDVDEVVQAYLAIREAREYALRQYEEIDNSLKADMSEIEHILLARANELNVDSFRTEHGTVMRQLKERFVCGDWDSFRKFEAEHPEYDFREKRIHQGNFKTFMGEHEGEGLPPGINAMREFNIVVRRSSSK